MLFAGYLLGSSVDKNMSHIRRHHPQVVSVITSYLLILKFMCLTFYQLKVLKYTKDVPDELKGALDHESFEKARVYQLDRSSFGFISGAYSQLETTVRIVIIIEL